MNLPRFGETPRSAQIFTDKYAVRISTTETWKFHPMGIASILKFHYFIYSFHWIGNSTKDLLGNISSFNKCVDLNSTLYVCLLLRIASLLCYRIFYKLHFAFLPSQMTGAVLVQDSHKTVFPFYNNNNTFDVQT